MSIPEVGGPAGPDAGGDHRRPQREIPRSLQGRRGVTAPSRCRAVSGVTHRRAARRAWARMRSDRPCGRPAPPLCHRDFGRPYAEAPCLAGSFAIPAAHRPQLPAIGPPRRPSSGSSATPRWAPGRTARSRSGGRADIDGPGTSWAPNAGSRPALVLAVTAEFGEADVQLTCGPATELSDHCWLSVTERAQIAHGAPRQHEEDLHGLAARSEPNYSR